MTSLIVLLDSAAIDGPTPFTIQSRAVGKPDRLRMNGQVWGHSKLWPPVVILGRPGQLGGTSISLVLSPRQGRAANSLLRPPAVVLPAVVGINTGPKTKLSYSKRGKAKSRLPQVVYPAFVPRPAVGRLTPPRATNPEVKSFLRVVIVAPVVAAIYTGPETHLAEQRRIFRAKSRLLPPSVVGGAIIYEPIAGYLTRPLDRVPISNSRLPQVVYEPVVAGTFSGPSTTLARIRPSRTHPFLRAPIVVFEVQAGVFTGPSTTLAYSRRGRPLSGLGRPIVINPIGYWLQGPMVSLAPSSRGKPKSKLSTPAVVTAVQTTVFYGPLVHLARSFRGVPKPHLSPPAVVAPVLARAILVNLAPSSRGIPKSQLSLPTVVGPVLARPIEVTLARIKPPPVHSILRKPTDLVDAADLGYLRTHLAYSRRGKPKSKLRPPAVVAPVLARPIDTTLVRIRPAAIHSILRRPTDLVDAADLGYVRVHLAYSLRGRPKSRLAPPVVVSPFIARPIDITLARITPPPTHSILRKPTDLVDQQDVGSLKTHLAYSLRGKAKYRLNPPTVVFLAVEIYGPETTLVRIRPPRTMWNLGPMGPPAVVYAPIQVHLTYSVRGKPKSKLPQASLFAPIPQADTVLLVKLAYSRRGRPKSRLSPPTRVTPATPYFRELPVTLAPQRRGKAKSILRKPIVVGAFVSRPSLVSLAPSRFPRPKSRLFGYVVPAKVFAPIRVTLAPSRFPIPKSKLAVVVYAAKVYAPITVTLAPSRFPTPKSKLRPPAVVVVAFAQINPIVQLARITPPRVHSKLRPPAVVGAGVYFRGILTHLAYSVRGKPKSKLTYTAVSIEECYGDVMCGFDFAAEVCGSDDAATVVGGTTATDNVTGSDVGPTVDGASAARGSVTGDDARREGC